MTQDCCQALANLAPSTRARATGCTVAQRPGRPQPGPQRALRLAAGKDPDQDESTDEDSPVIGEVSEALASAAESEAEEKTRKEADGREGQADGLGCYQTQHELWVI
jgi:hypothetical protein